LIALGGLKNGFEEVSLEMFEEEDPNNWEKVAARDEFIRKSTLQAQFNVIKQDQEEDKKRIEEFSRTADLEASVHIVNEKLDIKEKLLA
jgi:hypothetical protein